MSARAVPLLSGHVERIAAELPTGVVGVLIDDSPLMGIRITDPAGFLARMSEGARIDRRTQAEKDASTAKVCGSAFINLMANRYGWSSNRRAAALASVEG
jgi:hypothetical protein